MLNIHCEDMKLSWPDGTEKPIDIENIPTSSSRLFLREYFTKTNRGKSHEHRSETHCRFLFTHCAFHVLGVSFAYMACGKPQLTADQTEKLGGNELVLRFSLQDFGRYFRAVCFIFEEISGQENSRLWSYLIHITAVLARYERRPNPLATLCLADFFPFSTTTLP